MRQPVLAVFLALTGFAVVPAAQSQADRQPGSADLRLASAPLAGSAGPTSKRPDARARKPVAKPPLSARKAVPAKAPAVRAQPASPARTTLEERIAASKPAAAAELDVEKLPLVKIVPPLPLKGTLGMSEASVRYIDGLVDEDRGDEKGAHLAFLEAAESGYGPAQKKLGQIYDKGNAAVRRDYAESLRWYQRAREQGENVPQPYTARNATTVR